MEESNIYTILEVANTHDGNIAYYKNLINAFSKYNDGFGMKLQVFKYDEIAEPDFIYYDNFKRFYFTSIEWTELITQVNQTKDVWIDLFDTYSVQILGENLDQVKGVKFQASTLYNKVLFNKLKKLDLSDKVAILNIAAYPIDEIEKIISNFKQDFKVKEIVLQVGFQSYPTQLKDLGISKIKELLTKFGHQISFADHVEGSSEDAIWAPIMAIQAGATYVEKHIMLETPETKIDFQSSLTPARFDLFYERAQKYNVCFHAPFINEKEEEYLSTTFQIPLLAHSKKQHGLISMDDDFYYKRTSQKGLRINEIEQLLVDGHILTKDLPKGSTVNTTDFKKAKIGAIVACRLKSSRLEKKALLKIGEQSSIELCLKNTLALTGTDYTVLATSDVEEDAPLEHACYSDDVIFHKGDPIDVIQRYLGIIDQLDVDIVIRITGDNPYISNEVYEHLMQSHMKTGADYTAATNACPGTSVEIMNTTCLRLIKKHFPRAEYSEYMTWYFKNNPEVFKLNLVDLPTELSRDYRLSLDYPEDLFLLREIEKYFIETETVFNIYNLFSFLDTNPNVASINKELDFTFKTDQKLIDMLNKVTKISIDA